MAFGMLELAIGLAAVLIVPVHGRIPHLVLSIVREHSQNYAGLLSLQFALIIAVTIVPTFLMGAIFPSSSEPWRDRARRPEPQRAAPTRSTPWERSPGPFSAGSS
jgi:hypothetical protein